MTAKQPLTAEHNKQDHTDQTALPGTNLPANQAVNAIRKRGSKSASIEATTTATSSEISEMIGNVLYWYDKKPVRSNEECADRLNEYFHHVAQTGEIPTVEKMCLALGIARSTCWNWKNGIGCNRERMDMIKKAYDIMGALDAELVSRNKIPQVTYIFRAKNFYDLSDTQQIVVSPADPVSTNDSETARRRLLDEIADDGNE